MSLKLACADFTFPLLSHDKVLDLIALLEFDGVDIGLFEGRSHLWPSREFVSLDESAGTLRKKLDERGLEVADVFLQMDGDFRPFAINHPQAERRAKARQWFEAALVYASKLGCHHVTILPGVYFEEKEHTVDSFGRASDELVWRVAAAEAHEMTLGVEAHVGSILPDPEVALKMLRQVPGLTLTLDYTHFTRAGLRDDQVHPLLAHASHFHARGACQGRLQCATKDNVIDYPAIIKLLHQRRYTGWAGVEYVWIDWEHCNECDNLSETILLRDQLRQAVAEIGLQT